MVLKFATRQLAGAFILAGLAAGLSGCNETVGALQPDTRAPQPRIQARPGVSPRGATLAVASVDGPPLAIAQRFDQQLQTAAASRDVVLTDPPTARYLARGYVNAYPVEGGAAIAVVWDVFDGQKRRLQRIEDGVLVKGAAADSWGLVDDKTLAAISGRSAEDLAAFLTNTPEAIAAGAVARATPTGPFPPIAPATAGTRALSFTETP